MTGIERLRELIKDYRSGHECEGIECGELSCGECIAKNVIKPIADQIERDLTERSELERDMMGDTTENVRLIVGGVINDMERHVLGHEGMEDSPVARWSRELRAALGGGERDPSKDVSMSAYDLLPQEDREAIAWVREHGGLERVKQQRCESIPRAAYERKRRALLGHIAECETALGKRRKAIARLADENDALRLERAQMRPRLMPEGMEWPRYDTGELVDFGDEVDRGDGVGASVNKAVFYGDQWRLYDRYGCEINEDMMGPGERVKHPAPKVLDADGVEIRVGDTVWHEDGSELVVEGFGNEEDGETLVKVSDMSETSVGWSECRCLSLTHRAPVLAADGRPLREGETVWFTDNGENRLTVTKIVTLKNSASIYVRDETDDDEYVGVSPSQLTHERPDSLDRLAEDIGAMLAAWRSNKDLFDAQEAAAGCVGENTLGAALDSLVRRAKKLAERDA